MQWLETSKDAVTSALDSLEALGNAVQSERGNRVTDSQADTLLSQAELARSELLRTRTILEGALEVFRFNRGRSQ